MPAISNFISSADRFPITKYTLEYRLCDNPGCIVCAKIGPGVITPDISIKGNNIRGELLWWMGFPVIDPLDKAHVLSIDPRVARKNMTWRSISGGRREGTCVVSRYQATSFIFGGNCFVGTILSHNITITWVVRKKRILPKAADW